MNNNSKITIRNSADTCRIDIEGIIGVPEEWQFDEPSSRVATYEKFRDTVDRIAAIKAAEVVVDIRSTGGDVNDALLIYDALKALDAKITTRCFGYTASAATIIAQAASEGCRQVSANALYLIHESSCSVEGNASELEARAELLRKTDERLAALYAARSGRDVAEFAALMSENGGTGRWLSPEETLAAGLADTVTGDAAAAATPAEPHESRIADFIARNGTRLLSALGISRKSRLPDAAGDINVLRFADGERALKAASTIAFREGQRRACASKVLPAEDPSTGEVKRSANERAYEHDAKSFARIGN